ncbi:probable glycerol-3-phosphate acyltransferase 2 [Corylus avellana]|uniref:probable glycerol-3-phosphate acyltransferase 2 n=1 Tax=Corylus avellana TaxID=13451 RepID=UPI001E1FAA43|nr:probable glycerol-3-phosphate acyltransferase 2 [Corylus avellana]
MAGKSFPQIALSFLFKLVRQSNAHASQVKYQKYTSLLHRAEDLSTQTLIFHAEDALLKSSSLFPYFMLVAFEAGGLLRALVFFLLYPLACLFGEELGLKIKVFLCFFGIKKEGFRIGSSVLPKFFSQDVGREGFELVMSFGRKVAVSNFPTLMVRGFLQDYLGVDAVVGRELKVVCGYFVGLMEEEEKMADLGPEEQEKTSSHVIGIGCYRSVLHQHPFAHCKEVYLVSKAEKRNWHVLPREKHPKPLIFHDGRLAFRPTPLATLAMFMWIPLGILLFMIRFAAGQLLPLCLCSPIMAFTGAITIISRPPKSSNINPTKSSNGTLYVCNHRTMLDPVYVSAAASNPSLSAVTYSISKIYEVISPINTIHLTRDREKDGIAMKKLLSQGDLAVCPEGTTCREPYLLRFSPLFAEVADDITPVAIDVKVTIFYGTTASGFKCLDPVFFLMNPFPTYTVKILEKLPSSQACKHGGVSKYEVANHVQYEIAKALGFECTSFTRKDKYMILAGNEGLV